MRRITPLASVFLFAAILFAGLSPAGPARALPAITAFETAGYQNTKSSADRTLGWIFTVLADMRVTGLGVWDHGADGLVADHMVGIWDAGGALLGAATVQQGTASALYGASTGGGRFRYEPVAGLILDAGAAYTIGALYDSDDIFDYYAMQVDTSPHIAFDEERYGDEGAGFVFPTDTFNRWGLFGPNFRYTLVSAPAAPGMFLAGLAALGVAAGRRRRKHPIAA